ncbi:MAG: chorismate mutase family protein [Caldilineaceae bacterium]|nr:chorismate mutase family protein [Caldilineaceae bacterium]
MPVKSPAECNTIEEIRAEIDRIDRQLLSLLGERFGYVKAITRFKKTEEDVRAPQRYQAVLTQRRAWAEDEGLDPDVIEQIYKDLIAYFIAEELKDLPKASVNPQ